MKNELTTILNQLLFEGIIIEEYYTQNSINFFDAAKQIKIELLLIRYLSMTDISKEKTNYNINQIHYK